MYTHQQRTGLTEQDAMREGLTVMNPCKAAHHYLVNSLELGEGHPDYDFAVAHLQECDRCREVLREIDPEEIDNEASGLFLRIMHEAEKLKRIQ
ncbi:hypothetical protein GF371_00875 [Candidatus Woesearchaeota archaeon]|nr:hypothetical protein [Candidatus Woesearchaeota archaeon]